MTVLNFSVMLCILILSSVLHATETEERKKIYENELYLHQYELLLYYKQIYAEEETIFDYCVREYNKENKSFQSGLYGRFDIGSKVGACTRRQVKLKDVILGYAQDQLGERSLAQGIYDECIEYYPESGVTRISKCVKTRIVLDSKLEDDIVEKKIYQKCDSKWRKHGASAINNCSITEANYYRDKGQLRD